MLTIRKLVKLRTCRVSTANEMGLAFCHCKARFHCSDLPLWPLPKKQRLFVRPNAALSLVGCLKGAVWAELLFEMANWIKTIFLWNLLDIFHSLERLTRFLPLSTASLFFVFEKTGGCYAFFQLRTRLVGQEEIERPRGPSSIDCFVFFCFNGSTDDRIAFWGQFNRLF